MVTGTKELSDSVLKVAVVSATVRSEPVAAALVAARVVVFRIVVGLNPPGLLSAAVKVTVPTVIVSENSGKPTEVAGGKVSVLQEATV